MDRRRLVMPARHLPVRPDLRQLRRQAKDLLKSIRGGDPAALEELRASHPHPPAAADAQLADAQLVLARSYQATSWLRLVRACEMIDAIWRDDIDRVLRIVTAHPEMIHEHATLRDSNWGPPMAYAANLGRDRIIQMLHRLGARDTEWALGRAVLQGKIATACMLHEMLGSPEPPEGALAGPAYTLSVSGTAFAFEVGARIVGRDGRIDGNAIEHLLGTDSRNPPAKHEILKMYVEHGLELPDTPVMALHRGRIDLLQVHLERDPELLTRTFRVTDVFPPELGCRMDVFQPHVAQGTPIHGATLLHIAAYFDEIELAEWLLGRGMDPDVPAALDGNGFGGYTALFSTVVSQHNFWVNYGKGRPDDASFTRLLLDRGADPNVRASLRQGLEPGHGGGPVREYRDVTPLGWGRGFPEKVFVSRRSLQVIEARGGGR
jgi:Ankyrin repeat